MPSTMLRCADLTPQTHAAPACFANVGLRRDVVLYQKRAVGSSPLCRAVCLHNHVPLSSMCCVVCPQPPASRCDRCSVPCGLPCAAIGVEQRLGRIRRRACQHSRLIKLPPPTWPMHLIQLHAHRRGPCGIRHTLHPPWLLAQRGYGAMFIGDPKSSAPCGPRRYYRREPYVPSRRAFKLVWRI